MFPGNLSGKGSPSIYFHFFLERMPSYLQVSSKGAVDISKKGGGKMNNRNPTDKLDESFSLSSRQDDRKKNKNPWAPFCVYGF